MKEVDNENINAVEQNETLENQRKAREYDEASNAKKVALILADIKLEDQEIKDAQALAENYSKLYDDAHSPEATEEKKKALALASIKMHDALKHYMTRIKNENPEALQKDPNVANINVAYSVNTHVAADALQVTSGDIFGTLIDDAMDAAEKNSNPEDEKAFAELDTNVAKLMYLSRLKYEYDNVTGTEDEKRAWRSEILTELLSDKFDSNVEKFKEDPMFKSFKEVRQTAQENAGSEPKKLDVKNLIFES